MRRNEKTFAEKNFQERFVKELKKYKWEAPDELNGNLQTVTVDDLIENWRHELNRINADRLEGVPLTDNEFKQVMLKVNEISNSYEAATILSAEGSVGKIDGIIRDSNLDVTRDRLVLTIFERAQVSGGSTRYQIAREVQSDTDRKNSVRFDVILLINGLPLINIELKRTDKTLDEAFLQFKRYYRKGIFSNNFMAFSQMMVISSEIDTRYFATPKSYDDFNQSFLFRWADKNNRPITHWKEVIKRFLMIPMAHQMVADYMIIDHAEDVQNRKHMVLRPYQVHALQAVEGAAAGWDNEDGKPHGGFVWHTTGSGKTVTSFKTALFLSTRLNFDNVIFLVDRRELDSRTSASFKAFAYYETVSVDDTNYTYQLKNYLRNSTSGIIVTTTFKLSILVNEMIENQDYSLADKRYVFIIDEAHRTTMGKMMATIRDYFRKNSLFFGFTGTPLFEENQHIGIINKDAELIDTTEKLFGPKLHEYTIDEAIADGNVLGFHVDYINTGEFSNYDDLRADLLAKITTEKPEANVRELKRDLVMCSDAEIEKLARDKGILVYDDRTHIPSVVSIILDNWDFQSQNKYFNAILTVAYKDRVQAYFNEFRKQIEEKGLDINVAMTFSFGTGDDPDNNTPVEVIEEMFEHYSSFTKIRFTTSDLDKGESAYFEDLIERFSRGGSSLSEDNIDLVIVADQLLTGYDSKLLNTLYVDRSLRLHGLIQAYSRTNRVFGPAKEFGSIVNFRYPALTEERVKDALILYGSGGSNSKVIVDDYSVACEKLAREISILRETLENPTDWAKLIKEKDKKEEFFLAFRSASEQMNVVHQYYEFSWESITSIIDEHTWLQYEGAYKNLKENDYIGPDIDPPPLIGKARLVGTQLIDAAYIIQLIGSKVEEKDGKQTIDTETLRLVYEEIQELSNMGDAIQARWLRKFVDEELVKGNIPAEKKFDEAYAEWRNNLKKDDINAEAMSWGIDTELLQRVFDKYDLMEPEFVPYANEIIENYEPTEEKIKKYRSASRYSINMMKSLPHWLKETKMKYGEDITDS